MTESTDRGSSPFGSRRRGWALVLVPIAIAIGCSLAASAGIAAAPPPVGQPLVVITRDHAARTAPSAQARRIEIVDSRRPLTRTRTVLPVLGQATASNGGSWLRVRLPGRPNGHSGWISTSRTKRTVTPWQIAVDLSERRLTVYRGGRAKRHFRAVVGKPSTPTPRGTYFVEEALAISSSDTGGPFALATSARSNVYEEFEGGPGQIGIHGTDNLRGRPGTAVSHGCIRLRGQAITWMARRIGAGVPLVIRR